MRDTLSDHSAQRRASRGEAAFDMRESRQASLFDAGDSRRMFLSAALPTLLLTFLLSSARVAAVAQAQAPLLLQTPTVSAAHVAFAYAGDIWVVGRGGGEARRLTTHAGREAYPVFSPDGSQLAFARQSGGNWDVYVMPSSGGEARRLTFHPDLDFPVNWTPDGRSVLAHSFRERTSPLVGRLYTVPARGGFAARLPLPRAWAGSFSPAADRIAYTPLLNAREVYGWRNYRGGATSKIWLARLSDGSVEAVPRAGSNDVDPMWIGDRVYFVSDRAGTENLFVYDAATKAVRQLTRFEKYGIKSASANGGTIVFAQGGALHLFDVKTERASKIDVRVAGDFPEVGPRKIDGAQWINWAALSPDAGRLLLGVRGEIFVGDAASGTVENITRTPAAAERNPVWSPDGKWIAYLSDESGEQELFLRPSQGGAVRRVAIERRPSFYNELQWSPDSKRLAFSDAHRALWYFDLESNAARRVDAAGHTDGDTSMHPAWSPDGRWLAYSKFGVNRVRSVTLYSLETGKTHALTNARLDAQSPVFDANGKYLYFLGGNRTALVESQGMSGFPFRSQVARSLYAVVLDRDTPSPFVQRVEQRDEQANGATVNGATAAARVRVDLENVSERVFAMPFWPQGAGRVLAGPPGVLFIVEGGTLHKFVAGKAGLEKFIEGAGLYRITYDGRRLLLRRQGIWSVVPTDAPPKADDGRLKLNPIELTVDPRAEWAQMYGEAWRRMREYFYDPNLHGQNSDALRAHYAAYLPNLATREDLNLLLKEMFSHLSTSHMLVSGGDAPQQQGGVVETVGLLGADFEIDAGRYRVTRVLRGDNARGILSPLAQPGVNVRAGEYILAVDGEEIEAEENLYRHFLNKAAKAVRLKVGPRPDGAGARTVSVVPLGSEYQLRQYDWAEGNRLRVAELSGGRLGYVYLPDTSDAGYNAFNREFYAQLDKQGLVVDGRFNEGGRAADYIIDTLRRIPLQRARLRDAEDIMIPAGIIEGPKVLLTNETAGSGGDSLPWMWRRAGVGPVVGTRTAGAGVGASTHQLIDGGSIRIPDWGWYDPRGGTWLMENRGVAPDHELEIMPADWLAGRDTQLERAVRLALDALNRRPPAVVKRPAYPVYK